MKKVIRNRQKEEDYIEKTLAAMHNVSSNVLKNNVDIKNDSTQSRLDEKSVDKKLTKLHEVKPTVVQPPLPPYPPPPDSPLKIPIAIKLEKEDPDEKPDTVEDNATNNDQANQIQTIDQGNIQSAQSTEGKIMCKKWARNCCDIPNCKFVHERIESQMADVYKFCWQYQNGGCTFPNCKYVHATVFEQGHFIRTMELPEHATRHLKQQQQDQQQTTNYNNSVHTGDRALPVISCVPTSNLESRPIPVEMPAPASPVAQTTSPFKRDWAEMYNSGGSPRDNALIEHERLAKKCKTCEPLEIREQLEKEEVVQSFENHKTKFLLLDQRRSKLFSVMRTLLKYTTNSKPGNGFFGGDKDKIQNMSSNLNYSSLMTKWI